MEISNIPIAFCVILGNLIICYLIITVLHVFILLNKIKSNNAPKVETLRMACYIQILCLSTLNLINQINVSHIKLSKYCDIDARLS